MKTINKFIFSGIFAAAFILLIVLLKTVDVAQIGPNATEVGLSTINKFVFETFNGNERLDIITDIIMIIGIGVGSVFALTGLIQLIKGRSFKNVDKEIYCLGGIYTVIIILYIVFEKIIINYKPIIEKGSTEPTASFPSSHTMLICVVLGSAALLIGKYIRNKNLCVILQMVLWFLSIVAVIGRILAGVHWFTDVVAAVLISVSLLLLFSGVVGNPDEMYEE